MNKTTRQARANQKYEQAAMAADRARTNRPSVAFERAARLITEGNAIKAGRPVPKHAKGG